MTFALNSFLGRSENLEEHNLQDGVQPQNERQATLIEAVDEAVRKIGEAFGGHLSISAYGNAAEHPTVGDTLTININHVPDPGAPTQVQSAPASETVGAGEMSTADALAQSQLGVQHPTGAVAPAPGTGTATQSEGGVPGAVQAPRDVTSASATESAPTTAQTVPQTDPEVYNEAAAAAEEAAQAAAQEASAEERPPENPEGGTAPEGDAADAPPSAVPSGGSSSGEVPPAVPSDTPAPAGPQPGGQPALGQGGEAQPAETPDPSPSGPTPTIGEQPAVTSTVTESAAPAVSENTLYLNTNVGAAVDNSVWPFAHLKTPDGSMLYHYSGDNAPGQKNGDGLDGGTWQVWDGPTESVS